MELPVTPLVVTLLLLVPLTLYILQRPIPSIPHAPWAFLTTDLPALISHPTTGFAYLESLPTTHQTPLRQVWLKPFSRPYLLLADYREARDILTRRREWDRSDYSISILGGVAPRHHINLKHGPAWRYHRTLLADTMAPAFLHAVAAPEIYRSATALVKLWHLKADRAAGAPFEAGGDISRTALDAVLDFTFGKAYPHRTLPAQTRAAETAAKDGDGGGGRHVERGPRGDAVFPQGAMHETLEATLHAGELVGRAAATPFIDLAYRYFALLPSERRFRALQRGYAREQILGAVARLDKVRGTSHGEDDDEDDSWARSAVDLMMARERRLADKEGRAPVYVSEDTSDEVLGFIVAGHDTTATTLSWGLKRLTDAPAAPAALRAALRAAHAAAVAERRAPTVAEIVATSVPYLDGVLEEMVRLGTPVPVLERQCDRDTTVLGRAVPKGTTMLLLAQGPSLTSPALRIPEAARSPSARPCGAWDPEGMELFAPERWLSTDGAGNVVFDPLAGPVLGFGGGVRGCFGRKLAYLEMRIVCTLLAWNFELLECGEELSGYEAMEEITYKPTSCYMKPRKWEDA
ncbi:Cytochrome monooxygenase TRI13 like protein [Verticillium longisporum]|uniref:Cytochrome monooxygenase TRI13 like protein n=1 Tax=Verticillium longisporum TaxID=100787 RepID=A0A8I3ASB3_VERLO|nr:Cytochrome monooxygenase TRI13 like protein [Verticillium longisporum]